MKKDFEIWVEKLDVEDIFPLAVAVLYEHDTHPFKFLKDSTAWAVKCDYVEEYLHEATDESRKVFFAYLQAKFKDKVDFSCLLEYL